MRKSIIVLLAAVLINTSGMAQSFEAFKNVIPTLKLAQEVKIEKESDATLYPISQQVKLNLLQESEGDHFAIGKLILSKTTVIIYYTKPQGQAPFGKITSATFTEKGKKISSEAIGIFSNFQGMYFNTRFNITAQQKGALAISSYVVALKSNGEVNTDLSKNTTYYISSKGKITKL